MFSKKLSKQNQKNNQLQPNIMGASLGSDSLHLQNQSVGGFKNSPLHMLLKPNFDIGTIPKFFNYEKVILEIFQWSFGVEESILFQLIMYCKYISLYHQKKFQSIPPAILSEIKSIYPKVIQTTHEFHIRNIGTISPNFANIVFSQNALYPAFQSLQDPYPFKFIFHIDIDNLDGREVRFFESALQNQSWVLNLPYYKFVFRHLENGHIFQLYTLITNQRLSSFCVKNVYIQQEPTSPLMHYGSSTTHWNSLVNALFTIKLASNLPIQRFGFNLYEEDLEPNSTIYNFQPQLDIILNHPLANELVFQPVEMDKEYFEKRSNELLAPYYIWYYNKTKKPVVFSQYQIQPEFINLIKTLPSHVPFSVIDLELDEQIQNESLKELLTFPNLVLLEFDYFIHVLDMQKEVMSSTKKISELTFFNQEYFLLIESELNAVLGENWKTGWKMNGSPSDSKRIIITRI